MDPVRQKAGVSIHRNIGCGFPFTATLAVAGGCLKIYLRGWKTQICLIRLGSYDVGKPPPIVPLTWSFGGVLHFQTDPHGDV